MEGYSFLVRIHNEEQILERSIRSLFGILVTYEILVFLNNCTDASVRIAQSLAQENAHIKIFEYNHVLSRPGYETLATDSDSNHSLIRFYNWSIKQATYNWLIKWDGDFIMTPALLEYLNANDLKKEQILRFQALSRSGETEYNDYASSCLLSYRKDVFWENAGYKDGCERLQINATIDHYSTVGTLKPYWHRPSWFDVEKGEESERVRHRVAQLNNQFGFEPRGFVRSENLEKAITLGEIIANAEPDYVSRH